MIPTAARPVFLSSDGAQRYVTLLTGWRPRRQLPGQISIKFFVPRAKILNDDAMVVSKVIAWSQPLPAGSRGA